MLICLVLSLLDRPFLVILMVDILSSLKMPGESPMPASCIKFLRYMPRDALSDRVTNSDSHVDFVTMCFFFFPLLGTKIHKSFLR